MTDYSPKARKAMRASEMKRRSRWPKLARTGDELILTHPHRGGYKHRADLAAYVAKELPEFKWNSKKCRWEAPFSDGLLARVLDAFTQVGEVQLNLDDSVEKGAGEGDTRPSTITLVVQYVSSGRYLRSKGQIVEVQEDSNPARPPRSTDPDAAGRYLEANGYRFDPAESTWLDRIGTTVRPMRKQVFRRVTA